MANKQTEKCCTPDGQIKRYLNCVGCDKKPIMENKQTAEEVSLELYPVNIVKLNNTLEIDSAELHRRAFIAGVNWQSKRTYTEEEVERLLETQRGNSYVAVLTATKNDETAMIALNAPVANLGENNERV